VPDGVPDEAAAPANCALSQVIQGLHEAAMRPGDAVVIQGAGGLGIYATAVARGMGARAVIVLDREEGRLALARRFGAHEAVDVKGFKDARELASRVRELTDGQGADLVMGLTGVPESVPEGLRMLAPGGRMVEIGNIGIGVTAAVDPGYMVLRGLSLRTAICYEAWALGAALEFLAANRGRLPLDAILSHRFPFERINEAMERADQGELFRATLDLTA
jgi:threonine dehydrogenase-like Zn-dependent dehydrogenase